MSNTTDVKYTKEALMKQYVQAKAKENFWNFCIYMDQDFFQKRKNVLKPIVDDLNEMYYSRRRKSRINFALPRRSGKTYVITLFIAWSLGKDFKREIIRVSHSQDIVEEHNTAVITIMNSKEYLSLFPESKIRTKDIDTRKVLKYAEHHRPSLIATSIESGSTGKGASIVISDDLYRDYSTAMSPAVNKKTINNYLASISSSLDSENSIEIIIGTRWRVGELVDILEEMEGGKYFDKIHKVKAINPDGTSFCDDIKTIEQIMNDKETLVASLGKEGENVFNAMYQQEPMIAGNNLVEKSDLTFVDEITGVRNRFCMIDPKSTGKDFFSCVIFAFCNEGIVVEDVIYSNQVLTNEFIEELSGFIKYYNPKVVLVETNKEYSLMLKLEEELPGCILEGLHSTKNKFVKIITNIGSVINTFKFMNTDDAEYNKAITELCSYDVNKAGNQVDDFTDSLTMAYGYISENANIF